MSFFRPKYVMIDMDEKDEAKQLGARWDGSLWSFMTVPPKYADRVLHDPPISSQRVFAGDWEQFNRTGHTNFAATFGDYHPKDDEHDDLSKAILRLKDGDQVFVEFFADEVVKRLNPTARFGVCAVPSSSRNPNSGPMLLARAVAHRCSHAFDASGYLQRTQAVGASHLGNSRGYRKHLDSIQVNPSASVKGEEFLLLDDVTTTGNSLRVCRNLLLGAGASAVVVCALGQTRRSAPNQAFDL